MARFHIRPKAFWQGPIGAVLVTAGVWWLASPAWALVAAGGFLLVAAFVGA